jgi:hypothetical protein
MDAFLCRVQRYAYGLHRSGNSSCIDKITNNPDDRRIVMSAWTPKDLDMMAPPKCTNVLRTWVSEFLLSTLSYAALLMHVTI